MVDRSAGAGSVVAYNYMDDGYINGSDGWVEVGLNASHMIGGHHVLFEGNYSFNTDSNQTHGNVIYHTFLHNYFSGFRKPFAAVDGTVVNDAANKPAGVGPLRAGGRTLMPTGFRSSAMSSVAGTDERMDVRLYRRHQ